MNNTNHTMGHFDTSQLELQKANLGDRIVAHMIDHFLLTMVMMGSFAPIIVRNIENVAAMMPIMVFVMTVIGVGFVYGLKDSVKGQSFGKHILGIAVRDSADPSKTPSIARMFLRNIFSFMWPLEFIVLACSGSKIGDKLTGANVYRVPQKRKWVLIVLPVVLFIVVSIGAFVFGIISLLRNDPSYHAAISYIEAHPRVVELVGDIEGFRMTSGNISSSGGHGQAEFSIRVNGSDGMVRVNIMLRREPSQDWEVIRFQYRR